MGFWPPFASMLGMELWNSTSGPLVRLVLNSKVVVDTTPWDKYRERLHALSKTLANWTATMKSHPVLGSSLVSFGWIFVCCLALAWLRTRRDRKLQMRGCEQAGTLIALHNNS